MTSSPTGVPNGPLAAAISDTVVRVLREHTGRGPTQAKTTINGDLVVCVLHDTLTVGERTLVASGQSELVLSVRHRYQQAMRPALSAAIESHTGRTVIAFMSDNHIDPDMAVEAFVLAPESPQEPAG
jgi:uncharacterized protein YbcI